MGIREKQKQETNQRLKDAMQRLIDGVPTDRDLKSRKTLKVNEHTVQIEAGLPLNTIRHHSDVRKAILKYQESQKQKPLQQEDHCSDLVGLQQKIIKQKNRIEALNNKLKTETKLKEEYRAKAKSLERVNTELLEGEHHLIQALLSKVPLEERQAIFNKYESGLNIVSLPKRNDIDS